MIFDMQQVFNAMARQNTSIYPSIRAAWRCSSTASTRASRITTDATSLRQTQDTLHVLADNTDGRAIINRNDLAVGMKQIIRDSSGYYLLGYSSTPRTDRREIPQHQSQRQAEGGRDPRTQRVLGVFGGRRGANQRGGEQARGAFCRDQCAQRSRCTGERTRPRISGLAPPAVRTA